MNLRRATQLLITLIMLGLVGWDLCVEWVCGDSCTISRVVLHWIESYPLFLFAAGVLIGHLFFAQHPKAKE